MPLPLEIAPGISAESLKVLSPESPEGKQFADTLGKYHPVFTRDKAWQREWNGMPKGGTARAIAKDGKKDNRWRAVFVDCMEKRLGKPMNSATAASYTPVVDTVISLAKSINAQKLTSANPDFNMATFINCCLDRMGVGEQADGRPPNLESFHFNPNRISDPALPDTLRKQPKDPSGWSNDLKTIASSNQAVRLFVQKDGKARGSAVILAVFERNKGSELTASESRLILQQAAPPILDLIQKCGYKTDMTDVSFADLVGRVVSGEERSPIEAHPRAESRRTRLTAEYAKLMQDLSSSSDEISRKAFNELDRITYETHAKINEGKIESVSDEIVSIVSAVFSAPDSSKNSIQHDIERIRDRAVNVLRGGSTIHPQLILGILDTDNMPDMIANYLSRSKDEYSASTQTSAEHAKLMLIETLDSLGAAFSAELRFYKERKALNHYLDEETHPQLTQSFRTLRRRNIAMLSTQSYPTTTLMYSAQDLAAEINLRIDSMARSFGIEIGEAKSNLHLDEAMMAITGFQNSREVAVIAERSVIQMLHDTGVATAQHTIKDLPGSDKYKFEGIIVDCDDVSSLRKLMTLWKNHQTEWDQLHKFSRNPRSYFSEREGRRNYPVVTLVNPQNLLSDVTLMRNKLYNFREIFTQLLEYGRVNMAITPDTIRSERAERDYRADYEAPQVVTAGISIPEAFEKAMDIGNRDSLVTCKRALADNLKNKTKLEYGSLISRLFRDKNLIFPPRGEIVGHLVRVKRSLV